MKQKAMATADGKPARKRARIKGSQPPPAPVYWKTDADDGHGSATFFTTRYMRRKLEYLMRSCATHPEGCSALDALRGARVIEVQRIENHLLWER